MGKYRLIKETINSVAPKYSNVRFDLRGVPIYADPILEGDSRFSRKTGRIGLINPDTEIFLAKDAKKNQQSISVDRFNNWFVTDAYLTLGGIEKFKILTVVVGNNAVWTGSNSGESGSKDKIILSEDEQSQVIININDIIKVPQKAKASVTLYSVPVLSVGDFAKGEKVIQLRSKHKLIIGDVIAFPLESNLFREIECVGLKRLTDTTNEYPLTYELTLKEKIPYDLIEDQMIQLRAYPAYFSKIIRVPSNPLSPRNIGPFLVDYYGGKIQNKLSPNTFMSIQLYDVFGDKLLTDDPFLVDRNFVVHSRSITFDTMLFWNIVKGTVKLKKTSTVVVCDEEGNFAITKDLEPNWKQGDKWKVSINSTNAVKIKVGFEPNEFKEILLEGGIETLVTIGTENYEKPIQKITIIIFGESGTEVEFSNWEYVGIDVERIEYGIMARVTEEAKWLASGLIIKPFFLSIDYITSSYDIGDKYNSGLIYF